MLGPPWGQRITGSECYGELVLFLICKIKDASALLMAWPNSLTWIIKAETGSPTLSEAGAAGPYSKNKTKTRMDWKSNRYPKQDQKVIWVINQFSPPCGVGEDNVYKDNMICTGFLV